jgi:hypothetical protein
VGKPKERRPLERPETDLEGTRFYDPDWFHLAQSRNKWQTLVNTLSFSGFHNMIRRNVFICGIINFSIRVLPHVERVSRI